MEFTQRTHTKKNKKWFGKKNPLELASFHLCSTLLQTFVESVLTSGINSWLGRATEAERNRVGGTITAATKLHQSEQITKICSNLGHFHKHFIISEAPTVLLALEMLPSNDSEGMKSCNRDLDGKFQSQVYFLLFCVSFSRSRQWSVIVLIHIMS